MSCAFVDPAAAAAGDVARFVTLIPDAEWLEFALLRIVPADRFVVLDAPPTHVPSIRAGGDRSRPFVRAVLGDVASLLERLTTPPAARSWPFVLAQLVVAVLRGLLDDEHFVGRGWRADIALAYARTELAS